MTPTVQPPPLEQNDAAELATTASIVNTIHKLHDLLFKVVLPKTNKAENATITIEDLCEAHSLATSACMSLQGCHDDLQLNNISRKLETMTAHPGIPTLNAAQPPQNCSYTSVLATGTKQPLILLCPLIQQQHITALHWLKVMQQPRFC